MAAAFSPGPGGYCPDLSDGIDYAERMDVSHEAYMASLAFRAELADSLYSEEIERERRQDRARTNGASIGYAYRLLEDLETREKKSDG